VRDAVRPEPGTARQRNECAFRGTRRGRFCKRPKVIHTHEIDATVIGSNNNGVDLDCVDNCTDHVTAGISTPRRAPLRSAPIPAATTNPIPRTALHPGI
jgi:hypothetical protein